MMIYDDPINKKVMFQFTERFFFYREISHWNLGAWGQNLQFGEAKMGSEAIWSYNTISGF